MARKTASEEQQPSEWRAVVETFGAVPENLICDRKAPHSAIRLYAYIDWRAGKKRHAWPGYAAFQRDLGLGRTTISTDLTYLENGGYLKLTRDKGRVTQYQLPVRKRHHTSPKTALPTSSKTGHELDSVVNQTQEQDITASPAASCAWCEKPKGNDAPSVHRLLQYVHDTYRKERSRCPTLAPGRDGKCLRDLLGSGHPEAEIKEVYSYYCGLNDPQAHRAGYNVPTFKHMYDALYFRLHAEEEPYYG